MASLPELFREYVHLDRKRTGEGVSVAENARWAALRAQLDRRFSSGPPAGEERRDSVRVPIRLKIGVVGPEGSRDAVVTNVSRSGLFINTAFPEPVGTRIDLRLRVASTGELLEIPGRVVSNHVGRDLSKRKLGMGVCFLSVPPAVRARLDALYAEAGAKVDASG